MKDDRITVRLTPDLRRRLIAVCKKTGLDEPTAIRALCEAFCENVELRGGIWLPLSVVSKSPSGTTPTFPSTASRTPAGETFSVNEEPPKRDAATASPLAPRLAKTRAALRGMAQKEHPKQ